MSQPLWKDGPVLHQAPDVFPLGTDSILLADFARPCKAERILDLGTGGGTLPVLMGFGRPDLRFTAVENDPAACPLARKNLAENGIPAEVLEADLRHYREILPAGAFDLTVSNPPYFEQSGGLVSNHLGAARSDRGCTLAELCAAAAWATRWGGRFCLVFRPERIPALFAALEAAGFAVKRLRPVHHSPDKPANLLLIEARRGGNPGLRWEEDLFLRTADGLDSPEVLRIYHRTKE